MGNTSMLPIREFAAFTGIPESTLRYYDKIGLLTPELRGSNRYRYYSPIQMITVEFVKVLTKVGVPLSTIKKMSKNRTPQSVLDLLIKQERKLDAQLHELQEAYAILHAYSTNIQIGVAASEHTISVQEMDETNIILGQINDFSNTNTFYRPYMKFCETMDSHYPIGGYYENMNVLLQTPSQPTRFFAMNPHGDSRRKAGKYLVAYNKGPYGEFGELPQKLFAYAQENKLSFSGPLYIIYLLDEISVAEPNQYISQIAASVSKAR